MCTKRLLNARKLPLTAFKWLVQSYWSIKANFYMQRTKMTGIPPGDGRLLSERLEAAMNALDDHLGRPRRTETINEASNPASNPPSTPPASPETTE